MTQDPNSADREWIGLSFFDPTGRAFPRLSLLVLGFAARVSDAMKYSFNSCVVVPQQREIFVEGKSRTIAPKAFDLLVYLIEHRHRVVRREELIQKIWKGRIVVDNVVSRTIMQTRSAVGDSPADPKVIRTIQRIGYRFVADLEVESDSPNLLASGSGEDEKRFPPLEALRLGFLPFVNQTGDANLAWVELGLLSLVVQSLSSDARLSIPSTASILMCTEGLSNAHTPGEKATKLTMMLGVKVVIAASIGKSGNQFVMKFRSFGLGSNGWEGEFAGSELTHLAVQLARDIERRLFPTSSQEVVSQSGDNFVNECFSRAMAASDARQWDTASKFFAIVAMLAPDLSAAKLEYAYVMARIPDSRAVARATALLEESERLGDRVYQARANYVLALALTESAIDLRLATATVNRALELSQGGMGAEWLIRAHLLRSYLALVQKDYDVCARATDQAYRACEAAGNRVAMLTVLVNRGALESELGDVEASYATAKAIMALGNDFGASPAQALANASHSEFELGLFERCIESGEAFVQRVAAAKDRPFISVRMALCGLFSRVGDLRQTEILRMWESHFKTPLGVPENDVAKALDWSRQAFLEESQGSLIETCHLLRGAREILDDRKHYRELSLVQPWLILNLLRLGRVTEARTERQLLASYEQHSTDRVLRPANAYFDAMNAWQEGDHSLARSFLERGLSTAFRGRWQSYICLDLTWLALRRGEVTRAEALLTSVLPWIENHPAGLLTGAILAHRQKEFALARDRFRRHVRVVGGEHFTNFAFLAEFFESNDGSMILPSTNDTPLPSLYWTAC